MTKIKQKEKQDRPSKVASYKAIFKKSIPAILAGMLSALIPFVDNFVSGTISDNAVATVSFVSYLTMVFVMAMYGTFGIFGMLIGQYNGKEDIDKINKLHRWKLIFGIGIMLVGGTIMVAIPRELLSIFTSDQNLLNNGTDYVRLYAIVILIMAVETAYLTSFNALGKASLSLVSTLISIGINTTLDLLLVKVAHMGVTGLAYATIAVEATLTSFFVIYIYISKFEKLYLNLKTFFKLDKELLRKAFKNWPNIVMNISYSMAILVTTIMMSQGYDGSIHNPGAIMGILTPFTSLLFTGITGFGPAIYYFVSRELGKDQFEVAKANAKRVMVSSTIITLVLSLIISGAAYGEVRLFNGVSKDTQDQAFWDLTLYIAVMPAFAVGWLTYQLLAAGGQTKATVIFDTIFLWGIYAGLIALIFLGIKPNDFWLAWIIGQSTWYIRGIVGYILYKQNLWVINMTKQDPKELTGVSYWVQVIVTLGIYRLFKKPSKAK